jgi:hypothetical protein
MTQLSRRLGCATLACGALLACAAAPSLAYRERSVGSREQIAWVRRAAGNFLAAESSGNGAAACSVLIAPLRATQNRHSCQERWNVRLRALRGDRAARSRLRTDQHAVASAAVRVHGNSATIELPAPLLGASNRFVWTENCWMLTP